MQSYREEEPQRSGKAAKKAAKKARRPPRPEGSAEASEPKQSKATKTSACAKPKEASRRRKADSRLEGEEAKQDMWTESELVKLNQYVAGLRLNLGKTAS